MSLEWLPIAVALVTIVGAAVTYVIQRRVDRRHALIELRRVAYREFLFGIVAVGETQNAIEAVTSHKKNWAELFLVASDEVISATTDFLAAHESRPYDANLCEKRFAVLVKAMRSDGYESTKLSEDDLVRCLPVRF
ncbi:hypothetical protein JET14_19160 [Martelella lutilitoris]|uniref:Uncharacterized protein n=1 Tax=Martelella lutilitoris TaxID=2583532 RepID=A0A7T7HJJ7_9HYPH|nr:hypothetical protein [Martelella lutilitoris]QQM30355.1 hypothetical protein JET14_19160 [Martelella lutilitoris]